MDMLAEDVQMALALLKTAGTAGNLTTDAQIAAMALRYGRRGAYGRSGFWPFSQGAVSQPSPELTVLRNTR